MAPTSQIVALPKKSRSRISNGSSLLGRDVDGRSAIARRFRDIVDDVTADLGGDDLLSEGQRQMIRRAALMSVQAERMEAEAVETGTFDAAAFGALSDRLGRMFVRLGLRRVARDVGPRNPREFAAHFKAAKGLSP